MFCLQGCWAFQCSWSYCGSTNIHAESLQWGLLDSLPVLTHTHTHIHTHTHTFYIKLCKWILAHRVIVLQVNAIILCWCLCLVFLHAGIFPWLGQSELSYIILWPKGVWPGCPCGQGSEKSTALLPTHVRRVLGWGDTAAGQYLRLSWCVLVWLFSESCHFCCIFRI